MSQPGIGDDMHAPIVVLWTKRSLVRIATIGDGSCFVHAVCKACVPSYQVNPSYGHRCDYVANLRRDLAVCLSLDDLDYPGYTYWETSNRGSFARGVLWQIIDPANIQDVDYSLAGLRRLFNSYGWLGDETYQYISDMIDIDIYVMRATSTNLEPHLDTRRAGKVRRAIIIQGNGSHYETVALKTEHGLQTVFASDDELIQELQAVLPKPSTEVYDPETTFLEDVMSNFPEGAPDRDPPVLGQMSPNEPIIRRLHQAFEMMRAMTQ